jgi:hypothetical protein
MKFEIVKFLKGISLYSRLEYATITHLSDIVEEIFFEADIQISHQVWDDASIHYVFEGTLKLMNRSQEEILIFNRGDKIMECHNYKIKKAGHYLVTAADVVLLKLDLNKYYEFTTSDYEIADRLIEIEQ